MWGAAVSATEGPAPAGEKDALTGGKGGTARQEGKAETAKQEGKGETAKNEATYLPVWLLCFCSHPSLALPPSPLLPPLLRFALAPNGQGLVFVTRPCFEI